MRGVFACVVGAHLAAAAAVVHTNSGVHVPFGADGGVLVVEVASSSSFRLGVRFNGWNTAALTTPMVSPATPPANFQPVSWGGMSGIQTSFGALLAATDGSGAWAFYNSSNATLVSSGGPPSQNNGTKAVDPGIVLPVAGTAAATGPARPCLSNGMFDPNFYYNRDAGYLSFAVSSWNYDPLHHNCYPVSFSGVIGDEEGAAQEQQQHKKQAAATRVQSGDLCDPSQRQNGTDATNPSRSGSYPNGLSNTTYASCCAACQNAPDCIAFVWSDGSNPDPSGNCWPLSGFDGTHAAAGRDFAGVPPPPPQQAWWAMGGAADWYLSPTPTPLSFTSSLYDLTGAPAIPPRYAWGFMATYWGYDRMEEIEGNGTAFRDGQYPLDSMIADYDWFMANDADIDFGYDLVMFGPHNFTHPPGSIIPNASTTNAPDLFAHFRRDLNLRFGGIRKPRTYSNIALSNASGWLLPLDFNVGAGLNNYNMSAPGWSAWYVNNSLHFLRDGMGYWWNDEGETEWLTYTLWNQAEAQQFAEALPGTRFWSLNRAFQPGMQRNAAVTWTGDRQDCSHTAVLQFTVAGQLYTACDMTAPDATVLVRQYWNAVFLPIMRVHAMHGTPRFPYLWGGPEHQAAFRAALQTRYHFIPYLYSLGHVSHLTGVPIVLPASYNYPNDAAFPVSIGDATYMVSDALLPADVSTSNGPDPNENTTHVNVPPGVWYAFNSTAAVTGPITDLTYTDVPLAQLVLFVRAGAILTLNKAVVQYTDALGGDLEVHIYGGADGAFIMTEDDGATLSYLADYDANTKRTAFTWNDATRTLSWAVSGGYAGGPNLYTTAWPVLFTPNATAPVYHAPVALGTGGTVTF